MDFQITKNNVRDIVSRLRQALGAESVSQSNAFEAFAKALGLKNWDTLSGLLKREGEPASAAAPAYQLAAPVEVYVDAYACDYYGEGPSWAKVDLSQQFLDEVLRMQRICKEQGVDMVTKSWAPEKWEQEERLRLENDDLYVTAESWWFRARPKHADYAVETRSVDIANMLALLGPGSPAESTAHAATCKGVQFYVTSGDMTGFIQMLVDDGELDESFAED
jgi:hypothetical protein